MSLEWLSSFESTKEAELKKASPLDIKKAEESVNTWLKLQKINTLLDGFDFDDEKEDFYRDALQRQDNLDLEELTTLDKKSFEKNLIQTQINELEAKDNLTIDEKKLRYNLKKEFIALEKSETSLNNLVIAEELSETAEVQKTDQRLQALETALSLENLNLATNPKMQKIQGFFAEYKNFDRTDETWKQALVNELLEFLQSPRTIESIATDLWWVDSKEYQNLKNSLIKIEPNLRESFEKAEFNLVANYAKVKLWTNDLTWVDFDNDILIKTQGNLTIEASRYDRNLSLTDSEYKLASKLNTNYENQIIELNNEASKKLQPLNEQLTNAENITSFIEKSKKNWVSFDEAKTQIQNTQPEIYNDLWLESQTSYQEAEFNLQVLKISLEEEVSKITQNTKEKMEQIVLQNSKEAKEKDKLKQDLLEFFHSIGFDRISQGKTDILIDYMNRYPAKFGLQEPISLENWSVGFNKDFGDKKISISEKIAFIGLFNQMLGAEIIDENIAKNTTTLSPEAIMQIQVLSNKNVGYFVGNLEKEEV